MLNLSKILVKTFLPYPNAVQKIFKFWLKWSNFYQWFERKFLKTDKSLLKQYAGLDSPFNEWKRFLQKVDVRYGTDKWYMGFDVVNAPERVMVTKYGDCDCLALLGFTFFGNTITYNGESFLFKEFNSLLFESGDGHAIGIWENVNKNQWLVVTNNEVMITGCVYQDWEKIMESELKYIGAYKVDINQKLVFNKFSTYSNNIFYK